MTIDTTNTRNAIVAVLNGIPGIGVVNNRVRFARDNAGLAEYYVDNGVLHGWDVRHKAQTVSDYGSHDMLADTWEITGYLALDDDGASELAMDALLDTIRAAFKADETLGGEVAGLGVGEGNETGAQVLSIDHVSFCGVLCHRAQLRLKTFIFEEK